MVATKTLITIAAAAVVTFIGGCNGFSAPTTTTSSTTTSMWQILDTKQTSEAWKIIFGSKGERGEYMDGYSKQAMLERCQEDYKWPETFELSDFVTERAKMMSHLYDNEQLWKYVCMVAFAEYYVLPSSTSDDVVFFVDLVKAHLCSSALSRRQHASAAPFPAIGL